MKTSSSPDALVGARLVPGGSSSVQALAGAPWSESDDEIRSRVGASFAGADARPTSLINRRTYRDFTYGGVDGSSHPGMTPKILRRALCLVLLNDMTLLEPDAETGARVNDITTHGDGFRFYEIGFRCCSDP